MIVAPAHWLQRRAICGAHNQPRSIVRSRANTTDTRQRDTNTPADRSTRSRMRACGGKTQLVIVAAGK